MSSIVAESKAKIRDGQQTMPNDKYIVWPEIICLKAWCHLDLRGAFLDYYRLTAMNKQKGLERVPFAMLYCLYLQLSLQRAAVSCWLTGRSCFLLQ